VPTVTHLLEQLDALRSQFGTANARKINVVLRRLARLRIDDVDSLVRLHELLLFVRAYPHNTSVVQQTEEMLRDIPARVAQLRDLHADISELEHPDLSGIAGMSVTDTFTFPIVSWLAQLKPTALSFYWEWFEDENRIGEIWPSLIPLLDEDTLVEANIPFREWLRNARGRQSEVRWLIWRFTQLRLTETQKAQLYNSQKLYLEWRYSYRESRTGLRVPVKRIFFHQDPLIPRRDVRLEEEFNRPTPPARKLSVSKGTIALDVARSASTVRYRELYGFTNGDPRSVYQMFLGRGVDLVVFTLPPEKRLPLRAYHSAMIYKNGVPIGYFEGLSLFERMESGFNLYYTFRDGETAWLYARILAVMKHLTGVTAFTLDPYQIGFDNEEGIESGAFWFYRKLGFRSTSGEIQNLTKNEEEKIAKRKNYRTQATTLRKLAAAPMILELDDSKKGDWDHFQLRQIGFAVQRLMAEKFSGDAERLRDGTVRTISILLGIESHINDQSLVDFALMLSLVPDLDQWSTEEKDALCQIIEAKGKGSESNYLRLMQKHERFREEVIRIGSNRPS
jgi:hypothetical protein